MDHGDHLHVPNVKCRIYDAAMRLFSSKGSDRVTISELAEEAGVARGTVYNAIPDPGRLFEDIAGDLASEMLLKVRGNLEAINDPPLRLACGIRLFIRRSHEEPQWGRFMVHFGFSNRTLQGLLAGTSGEDLRLGIENGRYAIRHEQANSALAIIGGATLSGMMLVQEGYKTWRDAGSEVAELVLVSLGVEREEAGLLSRHRLPELA
nr:TetR/AcrR family transcriptional regulator [Rhizobium daejeonense]